MRGHFFAGVVVTGMLATVAVAATPKQVIEARQGKYKTIGKSTKAIFDELRKPAPDMAVFRANGPTLVKLSSELPRWFPKGTGPEAGVKTAAKADIWAKPAEFRTAAVNFNAAARAFNAAAIKGDGAAVGAAARTLGGTCKACHDNFKTKDD
jgi:cytochrome c556